MREWQEQFRALRKFICHEYERVKQRNVKRIMYIFPDNVCIYTMRSEFRQRAIIIKRKGKR